MPSGNLANALSVGAKTVNGPSPFRVSIKSAAFKAAASVLKLPAETAVSTMSLAAALYLAANAVESGNRPTAATSISTLEQNVFILHTP